MKPDSVCRLPLQDFVVILHFPLVPSYTLLCIHPTHLLAPKHTRHDVYDIIIIELLWLQHQWGIYRGYLPFKFYVLGQIVSANSADQDQTASEEAV